MYEKSNSGLLSQKKVKNIITVVKQVNNSNLVLFVFFFEKWFFYKTNFLFQIQENCDKIISRKPLQDLIKILGKKKALLSFSND